MPPKYFSLIFLISLILLSFNEIYTQDQKISIYAELAEEHQFLLKFQGTWKLNIALYSEDAETIFGYGKTENKMMLQDLFVKMERTTITQENPLNTFQILGFDVHKKKFILINLDDMHSSYYFFEGTLSDDKKQIVFYRENTSEVDNMINKIIITFDRDNKYTYQVFFKKGKKEIKTMEIQFIKQ